MSITERLKIKIWAKIVLKLKFMLDLLQNLHTSQFEDAEYESGI